MSPRKLVPLKVQSGVVLLEALVSILIFSMGLIAIMGFQAVSVKNTLLGKYRNDASFLANAIVGQMWADAGNLAKYGGSATFAPKDDWKSKVTSTLPSGAGTIAVSGSDVTVTVSWTVQGINGSVGSQHYTSKTSIVTN